MIAHSRAPYNAEPPLARLREAPVTPQSAFYVRSHGRVPRIDAASHLLRVEGRVREPLSLSFGEVRRFAECSVTATLQCAGNRRAELQAVRPVAGDPWSAGAIGNAVWTGARLADVLRAAGAEEAPGLHVAFTGCDDCESDGVRYRFGASIPLGRALSPEVVLAWAMNGESLAPEHGFPLRAVVPGYAGVRSAKWLAAITVQDRPSDAHPQARDYKLFPPDIRADTAEWSQGATINEMPVNAAICEPAEGAVLRAGRISVRGYAIASGRAIARVEVSADGGASWCQAELAPAATRWSWTFWRAGLDLRPGGHELAVRAWDEAGQTQPARPEDVWNFKGYLCAAWHRVRVRVH